MNMNTLLDRKILHAYGVGRRAADLGSELFGWSEDKCRQMFILGLLHDVGYHFTDNQLDHEHLGGDLLHDLGFRYWKEVYHHGKPSDYDSKELLILNLADLTTDLMGEPMMVIDRLRNIAMRYGQNSLQLRNSTDLALNIKRQLIALGFVATSQEGSRVLPPFFDGI